MLPCNSPSGKNIFNTRSKTQMKRSRETIFVHNSNDIAGMLHVSTNKTREWSKTKLKEAI